MIEVVNCTTVPTGNDEYHNTNANEEYHGGSDENMRVVSYRYSQPYGRHKITLTPEAPNQYNSVVLKSRQNVLNVSGVASQLVWIHLPKVVLV